MEVLSYTLCKERFELYTKTHGSIVGNNCQIKLAKKDKILLKDILINYLNEVSNTIRIDDFFTFTFSAATYSINVKKSSSSFTTKIKL